MNGHSKPFPRKRKRWQPWQTELQDLIRGICGGFLFGIPLLYTMEVWWIGSIVNPTLMLTAIALTYTVVFLLNRTAGFRSTRTITLRDAAMDSIEAIAIGVLCTSFTLILLRQITPEVPLDEALGKILFESVPFTLGVALSNQIMQGKRSPDQSDQRQRQPGQQQELNATFADVGATLIGATIIAFSIAPTDEIPMLAAAIQGPWLLAMIITSLLLSYGIVFAAGFSDQQRRWQQQGMFQHPVSETVFAYLVSLAIAAVMLWSFQQLSPSDPWSMWLRQTLILGLPATIGGAAGRLAL